MKFSYQVSGIIHKAVKSYNKLMYQICIIVYQFLKVKSEMIYITFALFVTGLLRKTGTRFKKEKYSI